MRRRVAGLSGSAVAFACVPIATLHLSSASGPVDAKVDVAGSADRVAQEGGVPVVVRWNGVEGPELARTTPDNHGNIVATGANPIEGNEPPGAAVVVVAAFALAVVGAAAASVYAARRRRG